MQKVSRQKGRGEQWKGLGQMIKAIKKGWAAKPILVNSNSLSLWSQQLPNSDVKRVKKGAGSYNMTGNGSMPLYGNNKC
jgi:hypothetical protein